MSFVKSLQLHAYRNYHDALLRDMDAGFVVITGENGAGKTNVLEALSMLTPGRGIRSARTHELRNAQMPDAALWSVSSVVDSPFGDVRIGTGAKEGSDRRIVRVNGVDLKAQADLSEYLSCVWLTPQMDGLFLGAPSDRRRFFDRLVFAFDPSHAGRIARYENATSQRSRILKESRERGAAADPSWLSSLELTMAETGVAIAAARLQTLENLETHIAHILRDTGFPIPHLKLDGLIEEAIKNHPALKVEDDFRKRLEMARPHDAEKGGAIVGPHKTDLDVTYAARKTKAAQCSTGEQKALLTGLVLAHAVRTYELRDAAPLLLLDEVAAHFDEYKRAALFDILSGLKSQVFITGTDAHLFSDINDAQHLSVSANLIAEAA